jgi:hypothetical protein
VAISCYDNSSIVFNYYSAMNEEIDAYQ